MTAGFMNRRVKEAHSKLRENNRRGNVGRSSGASPYLPRGQRTYFLVAGRQKAIGTSGSPGFGVFEALPVHAKKPVYTTRTASRRLGTGVTDSGSSHGGRP